LNQYCFWAPSKNLFQQTANVGSYGITQGTLAASANYALTYVGANLTVTAAPLSVTAGAQSRNYGTANPTLTYVSTGLVNGDALTRLLATAATTTSNIGSYGITQATLAASTNYALIYVGANLSGGVLEHRQLWDHSKHARRLGELRPQLCRRRPDRDGGRAIGAR
jgi:hypothetical protein